MRSMEVVVAAICKSGGIRSGVFHWITAKLKAAEIEIMEATEEYLNHKRIETFSNKVWGILDQLDDGTTKRSTFEMHFLPIASQFFEG